MNNRKGWVLKAAVVCFVALGLAACSKEPTFNDSPNPLPNYIKNYQNTRKSVTVSYCRLLNQRTHEAFQGAAKTRVKAKQYAMENCLLKTQYRRDCTTHPKYSCGERKQLEEIDDD